MIGNEILIAVLNQQLADKLSAINKNSMPQEILEKVKAGENSSLTLPNVSEEIQHAEWLLQNLISIEDPRIDNKLKGHEISKDGLEEILPFQAKLFEEIDDTSIAIFLAHSQIGGELEDFDSNVPITNDIEMPQDLLCNEENSWNMEIYNQSALAAS